MNARLAARVLDAALQDDRFTISNWITGGIFDLLRGAADVEQVDPPTREQLINCTTTACLAGWTVLLGSDNPAADVAACSFARDLVLVPRHDRDDDGNTESYVAAWIARTTELLGVPPRGDDPAFVELNNICAGTYDEAESLTRFAALFGLTGFEDRLEEYRVAYRARPYDAVVGIELEAAALDEENTWS